MYYRDTALDANQWPLKTGENDMALTELEKQLVEVLEVAQSHLDYCGYGDSWERECARVLKLEERIRTVIALARNA